MPLPDYTPQQLSRTAFHFLDWREEGDIFDLSPAYQRTSVWTDDQRRALVRSLQMGLPVGAIWTNERPAAAYEGRYAVVDGKQRITALRAWFDGAFTVPAAWFALRDWEVARGYPPHLIDGHGDEVSYADLTEASQRRCAAWRIAELAVSGLSVEQEAELFLLVNTAGTSHTDEDLARAAAVAAR